MNPAMAKNGTKIKDLARELGMTPRALIDRCRAEGVHVQNSITKLGPQTEQRIRTWFDATGRDKAGGPIRDG